MRGRWWLCLGRQEGCLIIKALLSKVINFSLIGNSDKRPMQETKDAIWNINALDLALYYPLKYF